MHSLVSFGDFQRIHSYFKKYCKIVIVGIYQADLTKPITDNIQCDYVIFSWLYQEASRLSPGCAMCSWGFAHASGPTLNVPVKSAAELRAGDIAAKQAMKLLEKSTPESYTPKEQA